MAVLLKPAEAYRRVALDARVAGADPAQLVLLCYEQLTDSLGQAIEASARGDNPRRSAAMTKAMSALTALQLGLDPGHALSATLSDFFSGVRRVLLDNVPAFDAAAVAAIKSDVVDVADGLIRASRNR